MSGMVEFCPDQPWLECISQTFPVERVTAFGLWVKRTSPLNSGTVEKQSQCLSLPQELNIWLTLCQASWRTIANKADRSLSSHAYEPFVWDFSYTYIASPLRSVNFSFLCALLTLYGLQINNLLFYLSPLKLCQSLLPKWTGLSTENSYLPPYHKVYYRLVVTLKTVEHGQLNEKTRIFWCGGTMNGLGKEWRVL